AILPWRRIHGVKRTGSCVHQCRLHSSLTQNQHHAVDGVAFSDRAQIKLDTGMVKTHGARGCIKLHLILTDDLSDAREFVLGGIPALPSKKSPSAHKRTNGNIEGSIALASEGKCSREQ